MAVFIFKCEVHGTRAETDEAQKKIKTVIPPSLQFCQVQVVRPLREGIFANCRIVREQ